MHEVRKALCGHRKNFQSLNFIQSPCCWFCLFNCEQAKVIQHVNLQLFQFSIQLKVTAAKLKIFITLEFPNIFQYTCLSLIPFHILCGPDIFRHLNNEFCWGAGQCIMDVFKDVLNIMEKWSVSRKCNSEQNRGTAAHSVTLLRNPSNRDNAGISDHLHFPTTCTNRQAMYKKPWVENPITLLVDAVQDIANRDWELQTETVLLSFYLEKALDKPQWSSGFWGRKRKSYGGR